MNIAPRRVLLPLTAAVLLAHLSLLQQASHTPRQPAASPVAPMATRLIPAPPSSPPAPALAEAAASPPSPAPAPRRPQAVNAAPPRKPTASPVPAAPARPPLASDAAAPSLPADASTVQAPGSGGADASVAPTAPPAGPASAAVAGATPAPSSAPPSSSLPVPLPARATASGPAPAASAPTEAQRRLLATRYQALSSVRLGYDVLAEMKGIPLRAQGELLWQQDGQNYTARMEIKAFLLGSRVQTSAGRITAHALAPTRFSDKSRSELAAHFRDDQGRVTFSANTPDAPLQPMAQDRLSIFLQLAGMLAAEPAKYPPGTRISMQTVGPRSAEDWDFIVEAEEPLELAGGRMAGLKLVHAPVLDFDQRVELWFAPTRGYQPVRIRITQADGSFVDMQWRSADTP